MSETVDLAADPAAGEGSSYAFRPSLIGAPSLYTLTGDGIAWVSGGRSGHIPYRRIRRLRMSFKPKAMQSHRYVTELWAEGGPKLKVISSSWKSLVEQERLDKPYTSFIGELHRRIMAAQNPAQAQVRFEQGSPALIYWPGLIVFFGIGLGLAITVALAMQSGAMEGAAFIAVVLAFFVWQGGQFFRRNRPGVYSPDAPPAVLMPKG